MSAINHIMMNPVYSVLDYVQDGLAGMWDGVENAGFGVHDAGSLTWRDLYGGLDLDVGGCGFGRLPGLNVVGKAVGCTRDSLPLSKPQHIEIGFRIDSPSYSGNYGLCNVMSLNYSAKPFPHILARSLSNRIIYSSFGVVYSDLDFVVRGVPVFLSLKCDWTSPMTGAGGFEAFVNGKWYPVRYYSGSTSVSASPPFTLNGRLYAGKWEIGFTGVIYYVRFYSRALTRDEVSWNHARDLRRFARSL